MESWKQLIRGSLTRAAIVATIVLATDILTIVTAPVARAAGLTPREIAITDDEAGRQAARAVDKDGEDGRSVWVQLRWERDQESADAATGPATVENVVWVAKDLSSARAIYKEQAALNKDFPEAFYGRKGTYPFTLSKIGDEGAGISACERSCNAGGEIYVHKRLVSRVANVVSVVYLWGLSHEEGTSDWHARYLGDLVVTRSRGAATAHRSEPQVTLPTAAAGRYTIFLARARGSRVIRAVDVVMVGWRSGQSHRSVKSAA